jgi:dTDP-glucose pyrophosphorylase
MTDIENFWTQTVLPIDSKIRDAAELLNKTSLKIVMVTDSSGAFIGTISDGDIRRGLLKGLDLSNPIEPIVHFEALVVPPGLSRNVVMKLMKANKIHQIPIVNEKMEILGLHLWDQVDTPILRENIMVIMAGGKGTRLHPQTENCPKPMLLIAGKPILEHIIERAKSEGFSHFVLAIYHLGHMIEKYFGNGDAFGVQIEYLREKSPLGTAGALSILNPIPDNPFVVTNGDVIADIHYGDLLDFHVQHAAIATMAVRVHEWQNPFGVVKTQGLEIIDYEEKPISRSHINAGVYTLEPSVIRRLAKSEFCDMPTLFEKLRMENEKVVAYPIHERWLDIGQPDQLQNARRLSDTKVNKSADN